MSLLRPGVIKQHRTQTQILRPYWDQVSLNNRELKLKFYSSSTLLLELEPVYTCQQVGNPYGAEPILCESVVICTCLAGILARWNGIGELK